MSVPGEYECYWCHFRSPREEWGPGWVRCPKCKRIAPSVAEVVEMESPPPAELTTAGAFTLRKEVRDIIAGHGAGYSHDIDARADEAIAAFEVWLRRRQRKELKDGNDA